MTSATTISAIDIEPEVVGHIELNEKDKFAKRFKPSNLKQNNQSNNQKQAAVPATTLHSLRASDIKEHRWWSLGSLITCFFLIGPVIAFYHTRRIRKMKENQELVRAKLWSDRVSNILIISNIIGIIIWVAFAFTIVVLFIYGAF
ncbi:unnamed protein product [Adineta steineri]|uniref:Uncharacterized protein n=1 Tax=Adineta steineri TaxID=433720 RepID=A0A813PNK9_9BILA|nr:unnamed protein product [Adineta steineri]CAF3839131.1 unnamed protein product [Adineta steineri]